MAKYDDVTQEILQEYFEYKDGGLYWKKKTSRSTKLNTRAGYINNRGYCIAADKYHGEFANHG